MKPSTRAESGRRAMSLPAISTARSAARSEAAAASAARALRMSASRGGAQLLDLGAGGRERRGALRLRVGRRLAQDLVAPRGDRRGFRLCGLARRDRLVLLGLRVGEELRRRRAPLLDDPDDRPEQEAAQNPDEDEDVDRLQGQRPPVDPHLGRPI